MIPFSMDQHFFLPNARTWIRGMAVVMWLFTACANIVSPTGGPKDTTPPAVLHISPDDGSVGFTGNRFVIIFDEYIKLDNISQHLLVSPPIDVFPDFRLRGKTLTVVLQDSLIANATYAFHFGDAIRDITENNALSGFSYYLSTGDFIDSLTLGGSVRNARNQKLDKDIYVMLYPASDNDSVFAQLKPRYITRLDASGNFLFRHVAEDLYRLVALSDLNNNSLYDLITEPVAFMSEFVRPILPDTIINRDSASHIDTIIGVHLPETGNNLLMFTAEDSVQGVMNVRTEGKNKITVALKYPLANPMVRFLDTTFINNYGLRWNKNNDTLIVWLHDHINDSLALILSGSDFSDTLQVIFRQPTTGGRGKQKSFSVSARLNIAKGGKYHPDRVPEIHFDRPLDKFDTANLLLVGNLDTVPLELLSVETLLRMQYVIGNKLIEEVSYSVLIPPGRCTAYDGTVNDSIKIVWVMGKTEDFGAAVIKLISYDSVPKPWIVMLLDEKGSLVMQKVIGKEGSVLFEPLSPGKYSISAFIDRNNNGRWDTGDYYRKIQPEKVMILDTPIIIKGGWTEEIEWDVD